MTKVTIHIKGLEMAPKRKPDTHMIAKGKGQMSFYDYVLKVEGKANVGKALKKVGITVAEAKRYKVAKKDGHYYPVAKSLK